MHRTAVAYLVSSEPLPPPGTSLEVIHTIRQRDPLDRSRLSEALGWISSGRAEALLVLRLRSVATTPGELIRLLDWLEEQGASLVAIDVELDTATRAGGRSIALLREIYGWAREPGSPRRPPGRPGLRDAAPGLAERIARMRENGASLQAIAEALNAEGVPTPRGGAHWRPSSVQTVLGYRRPRPPAPGAPRPPRPRGPRPGPGPRGRP